jgi:hypothetical protein
VVSVLEESAGEKFPHAILGKRKRVGGESSLVESADEVRFCFVLFIISEEKILLLVPLLKELELIHKLMDLGVRRWTDKVRDFWWCRSRRPCPAGTFAHPRFVSGDAERHLDHKQMVVNVIVFLLAGR